MMTTMNMIEIERVLRELRLSGMAATLQTRLLQAQATEQPFLETLTLLLQDELDCRRTRLSERRFKQSGLDERPTLAEFDWRFNPKVPRQACFELHTLKFITEGINGLLIGKPGTGKSHIAKAVAYQATLQGYEVRYVEADSAFAHYCLASPGEQTRLLKAMLEPDVFSNSQFNFYPLKLHFNYTRDQRGSSSKSIPTPCQSEHEQPHRQDSQDLWAVHRYPPRGCESAV